MPAGVFNARNVRNSDGVKSKLLMPRTEDAKVGKMPKQEYFTDSERCEPLRSFCAKSISAADPAQNITTRLDAVLRNRAAIDRWFASPAPTCRYNYRMG